METRRRTSRQGFSAASGSDSKRRSIVGTRNTAVVPVRATSALSASGVCGGGNIRTVPPKYSIAMAKVRLAPKYSGVADR